ncbi:alpha/beta hydrolase family protein [Rhodoplanes sp. SY1]|uniref:alpha/beta hydrolase family protein n=1 Tax=Rhodoplanes sp. SY1 TaxID=3166646 RepID=UPI0038B461B4
MTEVNTEHYTFKSSSGTELRARLITPATNSNHMTSLVFMMTGDGPKGSKSLSWVSMPGMLAERGISSFVFDFEGLGYSEGRRQDLTIGKSVADGMSALRIAKSIESIDSSRIGVFGASFGGTIALLIASRDSTIKSLGLKSPVSDYCRALYYEFGDAEISAWKAIGHSTRVGFDYGFFEDAKAIDVYRECQQIQCPVLITHGSADAVVPLTQSQHLLSTLTKATSKHLEVFDAVGHGYNENGAWEKMANMFVQWFQSTLS